MHREGKPVGFFYLDRRTVDSKHDIITDIFATPGNTNDVKPYLGRLRVRIDKFGFDVKYIGLDAGCSISTFANIFTTWEYRRLWDTAAAANRKENTEKG